MNQRVLETLEFHKIIDRLAAHAGSEPGNQVCRNLQPETDIASITLHQTETADAVSRLIRKGNISFAGNRDIRYAIRSLEVSASLSVQELLHIADVLETAGRVRAYGKGKDDEDTGDSLSDYFLGLEPLTSLSGEIRRCILSEDEIADDASSHLKEIRRSMTSTNDKIRAQLSSMVNSHRTYLQDAVITMRDGRYCIPVKAEYKSQVPGMVHDQSSTGSTFFIEPAVVVELNNTLRELAIAEQEEIAYILSLLSAKAAEHAAELTHNQNLLTQLDFIFAKGRLALDMNATMPLMNEDRYINIRKGRHPLLDKHKVVPIDVNLGKEFDLLVITGPNTGGKTVTLKTVGLFTLMGQAGLHIPALDRSELSVFREVYADIGDEQSIEQSLSTFSSHMTKIVSILQEADDMSLCLFDELGAGTDPTEGAALAISILNDLHERGIRSMATTHYSELKIYALSTDMVQNACCEFDVESLRPTYRLLIGIPGKSNAFAISSKLGLPDRIIEKAREQISEQDESFEDVISDLEASRVIIEKERLELEQYKAEVETLKKKLQEKQEKLEDSRDKILREAREEARDILQEAKDTADATIRVMQKAGRMNGMKDAEAARQKVRDKINKQNNNLAAGKEQTHPTLKADQLRLGDSVKVVSMGLKGTVTSLPDDRGNLQVQCGIIKSRVNIKDLVKIEEVPAYLKEMNKAKPASGVSRSKLSKSATISYEINLLGKTVDEALAELDKYLDDAYLSRLPLVRIVHGKGTGALRSAVQSHLRKTSYVKSFRNGELGEGDAGVTIVEFK